MRKLFISLFLLPLFASAQQSNPGFAKTTFFTQNANVFELVANTIATESNSKVELTGVDTIGSVDKWYVAHYQTANEDEQFEIHFKQLKRGGNFDLGKPDTIFYNINYITGYFKTLFPFWKKYIQPNANREKVATDKHGELYFLPDIEKGKQLVFAFVKEGKSWSINIDEQRM